MLKANFYKALKIFRMHIPDNRFTNKLIVFYFRRNSLLIEFIASCRNNGNTSCTLRLEECMELAYGGCLDTNIWESKI